MSRLIDADAIIQAVCTKLGIKDKKFLLQSEKAIVDVILNAPTIDAVEVVRCKECKHWQKDIDKSGIIERINFSKCIKGHYGDGMNFFCSHGERRES